VIIIMLAQYFEDKVYLSWGINSQHCDPLTTHP
jgi:hypothetical protein